MCTHQVSQEAPRALWAGEVMLSMAIGAEQIALVQLGLELLKGRPTRADLEVLLFGVSVMEVERCDAAVVATSLAGTAEVLDALSLRPETLLCCPPGIARIALAVRAREQIQLDIKAACPTGLQSISTDQLQLLAVPGTPGRADQAVGSWMEFSPFPIDNNGWWDRSIAVQAASRGRFWGHSDKITTPD